MRIKIRDWDTHFEADRSRQWKYIKWVPVPNKQGLGYKKIMAQKNGAEIFGCWNAIVQQGSLCDPRGDLSKYSILDISVNTMIPLNILENAISFIIQNLDWIEVIENLDKNVNECQNLVLPNPVGSSILCNSILCNSSLKDSKKKNVFVPPSRGEFIKYFTDNGYPEQYATTAYNGYDVADWYDSQGKKIKNWKQKAQHVWFKEEKKNKEELFWGHR